MKSWTPVIWQGRLIGYLTPTGASKELTYLDIEAACPEAYGD